MRCRCQPGPVTGAVALLLAAKTDMKDLKLVASSKTWPFTGTGTGSRGGAQGSIDSNYGLNLATVEHALTASTGFLLIAGIGRRSKQDVPGCVVAI
jgi:hypothetical protein